MLDRTVFQRIVKGEVTDSRSNRNPEGRLNVLNPRKMTGDLAKLDLQHDLADGLTLSFDDNRLLSLLFGEIAAARNKREHRPAEFAAAEGA